MLMLMQVLTSVNHGCTVLFKPLVPLSIRYPLLQSCCLSLHMHQVGLQLAGSITHIMQQRCQLYGGVIFCLLVAFFTNLLCSSSSSSSGAEGQERAQQQQQRGLGGAAVALGHAVSRK
jgi:hypothetical protein